MGDYMVISSYIGLADTGYEISRAENGLIAVEQAEKTIPDLIIMDWEMPVMNGITAIEKLKENPATKDIPIIMITAVNKSTENLNTAFQAGAVDFIRYPIDKIELLARIRSVLLIAEYNNERLKAEKQSKDLLKDIVEHKKRELFLFSLNSVYKQNLLASLKKQIIELKKENSGISGINQLFLLIKSYDESEEDRKLFEEHFQELHNGFFEKLEKLSTELTASEKRFAAYLKIGLSSQDIVKILNITMEGIKKNRYRIRKKLRLDRSEKLEDFIREI
jgi:CheY-like chemotaxis protein/DNA-binding CsgD family transcriptional regulator